MGLWVLRTDRLVVRPMTVDDALDWHRVRALAPFDPLERSVEHSLMLVEEMQRRPGIDATGCQQFAVCSHGGAYVGDFGIRFSPAHLAQAEIGFAIDPELQGHGLATEAGEALVRRLFRSGRRRLTAVIDVRNRPAQRVLERLWFRQEGRFVESWRDGEDWFDELAYARLASD